MRVISIILGSLLSISIFFGCEQPSKSVLLVSSNPTVQWQQRELKLVNTNFQPDDSTIIIFPEKEQQIIDGFGGCFNELGWESLNILPAESREGIMASIFDPLNGCKFSICRMPMGANDYAVDWYSLNETKDDFAMENFSIIRDKKRLIPYIQTAQKYNPDLKVWASPWCPPSWMKTNNHYACKPAPVNDLKEEGRGIEKNQLPVVSQFRMEEKYLSAYALYFTKFLEAYEKEGIDIYAVHVQNEPNSCQNFPSCIWTPYDLTTFIGDYLGPQFEEQSPSTEIWLGTIERPQVNRIDTIIQNEKAVKYINGVGFQWGGKGAIPEVHRKYPNYKLMQTETECGDGSNDWAALEHTFELMKYYFNNGANSYMYWNMVLNETGKSQWGWKQNSMITIDSKSKEVTYNPEFYLMKHFSHFIAPGSHKIESSDKNCLAFKNRDSIIVIYYNDGDSKDQRFEIDKLKFDVKFSERSINTLVIDTKI